MSKTLDQRVKEIIVEQLMIDEETVTPSSSFDELGADSLDKIELVMAAEEAFDIDIPDEDAEKLATVQLAIEYLGERARGRL